MKATIEKIVLAIMGGYTYIIGTICLIGIIIAIGNFVSKILNDIL